MNKDGLDPSLPGAAGVWEGGEEYLDRGWPCRCPGQWRSLEGRKSETVLRALRAIRLLTQGHPRTTQGPGDEVPGPLRGQGSRVTQGKPGGRWGVE